MRILVCNDGSKAVQEALCLLARSLRRGDRVTLLCVVEQTGPLSQILAKFAGEEHEKVLSSHRGTAEKMIEDSIETIKRKISKGIEDVQFSGVVRVAEDVRAEISAVVASGTDGNAFDLVVCGSQGSSIVKEMTIGSVAMYLASHSPIPILVVKSVQQNPPPSNKIRYMVCADGSKGSNSASKFTASVARPELDEIYVVSAYYDLEKFDHNKIEAENTVAELASSIFAPHFPKGALHAIALKTDHIRAALAEYAGDHADIAVVGSRGLGTLSGLVLGSTTNYLLHDRNVHGLLIVPPRG